LQLRESKANKLVVVVLRPIGWLVSDKGAVELLLLHKPSTSTSTSQQQFKLQEEVPGTSTSTVALVVVQRTISMDL
jgi:hypothetical protein